MRDLLELILILSFTAGVCLAECIPVMIVCFCICFATGAILYRVEDEE